MRAQLVPADGGTPIDVTKDLILVGRKEDCDLQLDHKSVSKLHCVIVKTDGLLLIRDLGSTNGTRVNGQRIRRAALLPNDQLSIASLRYRVHVGPDEEAVSPHEHTQNMDAAEVVALLKKAGVSLDDEDSDPNPPAAPIQTNSLPDVYPDDEKK